jgi:uncharacterized membrane protein (UPF0127 family)
MVKQLFLPLAAVALFITVIGLMSQRPGSFNLTNPFATPVASQSPLPFKSMTVGSKTIKVEIANTDALRRKGLSNRNTLPEEQGMLFVFETKKTTPSFWMKDTEISLDMIWIRDGRVEEIDKDVPVPAPNTPDNKLPTYSANRPIDYILETNAGFTKEFDIKVGDAVTLPEGI